MNKLTRELGAVFWFQRLILLIRLQPVLKDFKTQVKSADQTIDTVYSLLKNATSKGYVIQIPAFNAGLYVAVVFRDLICHCQQMAYSRTLWERRVSARHLSGLLYEAGNDIPVLLGKHRFRSAIEEIAEWPEIERRLNSSLKNLRVSFDRRKDLLKQIRHNASAHHDKDALKLIDTIFEINPTEVTAAATDMLFGINEILQVLTFTMNQINKPANLAKYAARYIQRESCGTK